MPHPNRWFLLVILLALGVLLASCAEEFAPCPDIQVGVVEGYVRVLGEPAQVTVMADAVEDGLDASLSVATDSTGFYRMVLPSGSYRIVVEHESFRTLFLYNSDTPPLVEVGPLTRRWDHDLGRVDVAVTFPESYEGHRVELELGGDPGLRYRSYYRPVEAGRLAYSFIGVLPGTYELSLDWNTYGISDLTIPLEVGNPDSTWFEVGTEAAVVREFDFRSTAAVLAGNVGGGWRGVGVTDIQVQAIDGNFDPVAGAVCDAAGDFSLQLPLAVPVTLRAYVGGSAIYYGGSDASGATVLELQPGEERTGLDMIATGFVVRLHGPGDQSVYDGVSVTLLDASRSDIAVWHYSAHPSLHLNLAPGDYRVHVDGSCGPQTWAPQWYGGAATAEEAEVLTLGAGECRTLQFDLVTGASIHGHVQWADGSQPVATYVKVVREDGTELCESSSRGVRFSGGDFDYPGLADGSYRISARPGYHGVAWWYPGTYLESEAGVLTIEGGADITGVAWEFTDDQVDYP